MKRERKQLGVESLEQRAMMAGNVTASVLSGDTLILEGDNAGNAFVIRDNARGDVIVAGLAGNTGAPTKIAGAPRKVFPGIEKLVVLTKGGNDQVFVEGLELDRSLTVDGGAADNLIKVTGSRIREHMNLSTEDGKDRVIIAKTQVDDLTSVVTGRDNDVVIIRNDNRFMRRLSVNTAAGADKIRVLDSYFADQLQLTSAIPSQPDERDVVELRGLNVLGNTSIVTGRGNDYVKITNNPTKFDGAFGIHTQQGDDTVEIRNAFFNNLNIDTGDDNDLVTADDLTTSGRLVVSTQGGNDRLVLTDLDVQQAASFLLGEGNDTINLRDSFFKSNLLINGDNGVDTCNESNNVVLGNLQIVRCE